ncbi:MAG: carbohydrate kinase [Myxococcota bacterium]|nr:carbohydrate kinase [Myxococcota bacterium]
MANPDAIDVICLGETLVDFLPEQPGMKVRDVRRWVRCSGGSPANVSVGVARLGGSSAMVGVVGQDEFGEFLLEALSNEGVDVARLRQTDEGKTGLVFISLTAGGDRSFMFSRTRSAELFLAERDVDPAYLERARALHFGTNSLLFREAQRAMVRAVRAGAAGGKIVSCDPNLRLNFWPDPADLKGVLDALLPSCTLVKLSEEEIAFVTGKSTPEAALEHLSSLGVSLPIVTLAERGAVFLWKGRTVSVAAPAVQVLDTTGAGDGFVAALLFSLTRLYPDRAALLQAGVGELRELAQFACAVGSRVTEALGAVDSLPRISELGGVLPNRLHPTP